MKDIFLFTDTKVESFQTYIYDIMKNFCSRHSIRPIKRHRRRLPFFRDIFPEQHFLDGQEDNFQIQQEGAMIDVPDI